MKHHPLKNPKLNKPHQPKVEEESKQRKISGEKKRWKNMQKQNSTLAFLQPHFAEAMLIGTEKLRPCKKLLSITPLAIPLAMPFALAWLSPVQIQIKQSHGAFNRTHCQLITKRSVTLSSGDFTSDWDSCIMTGSDQGKRTLTWQICRECQIPIAERVMINGSIFQTDLITAKSSRLVQATSDRSSDSNAVRS